MANPKIYPKLNLPLLLKREDHFEMMDHSLIIFERVKIRSLKKKEKVEKLKIEKRFEPHS